LLEIPNHSDRFVRPLRAAQLEKRIAEIRPRRAAAWRRRRRRRRRIPSNEDPWGRLDEWLDEWLEEWWVGEFLLRGQRLWWLSEGLDTFWRKWFDEWELLRD
jgi:hypothetical protein